jgi:O-antigen/teichoic acid export membrane protein
LSEARTRINRESSAQERGTPLPQIRALARSSMLALGGGVISGVLGFALVVVITRGLGARQAGALFEAIALWTILSNTAEVGADTGLVRSVSRFRALDRAQDLRSLLKIALVPVVIIASVMATAMYVLAPQLVELLIHGSRRADAIDYLRVLAPFLPLGTAATVAIQGTRGFGTMIPYVGLEDVGKPLLRPILVVTAIAAGMGGIAVSLAWALPVAIEFAVALASLAVLLRAAERKHPTEGPGRPSRELASEFWRFSAPRGAAGFFQIGITWLDVLLVGGLRTTKEAGIYAAASRFVVAGSFAIEAIRIAIAPQISSLLAREEREEAKAIYRAGTWWLMALAWPFYITLAIFAPLLLRVFGTEFVAGKTAVVILASAMLLGLATGNVTTVLLMGGKSSWNLINTVVSLTLNVGLNLVLIPRYGINGAAIAWAATIAVNNLAPLVQVKLFLKLDPFGRGFGVVALAALVCYGLPGILTRIFLGPSLPVFVGFGVVASGTYVAVLARYRETLKLWVLRDGLRRRLAARPGATAAEGAPADEGGTGQG